MKLLLPVFLLVLVSSAWAQSSSIPVGPLARTDSRLGTVAQDPAYNRLDLRLTQQCYIIKGQKVYGSPFLFDQWQNGLIQTTDGRAYDQYKIKYDVFRQTVFFWNGNDSLEINDPVKGFSLSEKRDENVVTRYFIHSDQIKKVADAVFYEVVFENADFQLLKLSKKVVEDEISSGAPLSEPVKYFRLKVSYFYFDKNTKKISAIKADGANITKLLSLSKQEEEQLNIKSIDFANESSLQYFFMNYASLKKKAF